MTSCGFKYVVLMQALCALSFAVSGLFFPDFLIDFYAYGEGMKSIYGSYIIFRWFGAFIGSFSLLLLGIALLIKEQAMQKSFIYILIGINTFGLIVSLTCLHMFNKQAPDTVTWWSIFGLYLLFLVCDIGVACCNCKKCKKNE